MRTVQCSTLNCCFLFCNKINVIIRQRHANIFKSHGFFGTNMKLGRLIQQYFDAISDVKPLKVRLIVTSGINLMANFHNS